MISWGIFAIVLGIGSFVLPMIGLQFRLMSLVEDFQPFAGIAVAAVGVVLVIIGIRQKQAKK